MVALADIRPNPPGGGIGRDLRAEAGVGAGTVDAGLPLAQQVQIGTVENKKFHCCSSLHSRTASSAA